MAFLGLVNTVSYRQGINEIGDIIDVMEDTFKPNADESKVCDWVSYPGTRSTVLIQIKAVTPKVVGLYKSATTEWTEIAPQEIDAWEDGQDLYELKTAPKYRVHYNNGVLVHNFDRDVENTTKITTVIREIR